MISSSGNFTSFSAVCWLYGKYLFQNIKKPIGLIDTSWGGTPVEAWSSPDALKKCGLAKSKVWYGIISNPQQLNKIVFSDKHILLDFSGDNLRSPDKGCEI